MQCKHTHTNTHTNTHAQQVPTRRCQKMHSRRRLHTNQRAATGATIHLGAKARSQILASRLWLGGPGRAQTSPRLRRGDFGPKRTDNVLEEATRCFSPVTAEQKKQIIDAMASTNNECQAHSTCPSRALAREYAPCACQTAPSNATPFNDRKPVFVNLLREEFHC